MIKAKIYQSNNTIVTLLLNQNMGCRG